MISLSNPRWCIDRFFLRIISSVENDEVKGIHSIVPPLIDISVVCLETLQQLANQKMTTINFLAFMWTSPYPLNVRVPYIYVFRLAYYIYLVYSEWVKDLLSPKSLVALALSLLLWAWYRSFRNGCKARNKLRFHFKLFAATNHPTNQQTYSQNSAHKHLRNFKLNWSVFRKKPNISHSHSDKLLLPYEWLCSHSIIYLLRITVDACWHWHWHTDGLTLLTGWLAASEWVNAWVQQHHSARKIWCQLLWWLQHI